MHKVIFDTDPGVDDAMALLFLHRHPEIDLLAVTTVFGNASVELTTRNALYLGREFGISAPIARGANRTLDPARTPAPWPTFVHGHNGLGDAEIPDVVEGITEADIDAVTLIIDLVRAHPGEITLIAVGRMTNLANALRAAPDIADLVKEVILMGGNFYVPGNVTPLAEANIHGDPEAADAVITAKWPVVVVPLDVTHQTTMSRTKLAEIAEKGGKSARLLNEISQDYISFYRHLGQDAMLVHDSCACVYLIARELFSTKTGVVRVICGGIADGQTSLKPDERNFPPSEWDGYPSQTVCLGVNADAVLELLESILMQPN